MSERTERMIGSVAPGERDDPNVQAVMRGSGEEYDRIEDLMVTVRDQAWPHRADDTLGLLSLHEHTLGVVVAPEGVTVAQRQGIISATFGRRRDGRSTTWGERLDDLVGAGQWQVFKHTPTAHQITVLLTVEESTGLAAQVLSVIQRFTPVVDQVFVTYADAFFIGISPLGDTDM